MNTHARLGSLVLRVSQIRLHNLLVLLAAFLAVAGATRSASAATRAVGAGANLEQALDEAQPGDTLVLEAGAVFVGPFTLPAKAGDGWITVQSSALGSLPGDGQRVSPSDSTHMPKVVSSGRGESAL